MQKISAYIYTNRIPVVCDLGDSLTEWRVVFQRNVKIYKGIDNTLEFTFKNSQQRPITIDTLTMKMVITDEAHQEVYTATMTPSLTTPGLASCIIPSTVIQNVSPQLLKYAMYILNSDNTKTPIYNDVNYGMSGDIELIGGILPELADPLVIDVFNYMTSGTDASNLIRTYTSNAVEINAVNDFVSSPIINLELRTTNLEADITVQISNYAVISSATVWTDLETFSVVPSTTRIYKSYTDIVDYSNNVGWLRIQYIPKNQSTGTIDKVIVQL